VKSFGQKKHDFPLARMAGLVEGLESVRQVVRHDAGQGKVGKFLSNAQHHLSPVKLSVRTG
jgi:hypothetical protein